MEPPINTVTTGVVGASSVSKSGFSEERDNPGLPTSFPGFPPLQKHQSSTAGAFTAVIHQATVDLELGLEVLVKSLATTAQTCRLNLHHEASSAYP